MKFFKKLTLGVINIAVIALIAFYAYQFFEEYITNPWTRNGQVRGHVIQIAPRVSGIVVNITVVDNQFVTAGDLLFEIDGEIFIIAISQAQANLDRAKISSKSAKIEYDRLKEIFANEYKYINKYINDISTKLK